MSRRVCLRAILANRELRKELLRDASGVISERERSMKIEIRENVNRPAWTSRSLTGQGCGTVRLPGNTLGLDDTLKLIEREEEVKKNVNNA